MLAHTTHVSYVPLDEAAVQCGLSREALALRILEDGLTHRLVEGRVVVEETVVDRYAPWWQKYIQSRGEWYTVVRTRIWPALVAATCDELGIEEMDLFNGRRDRTSVARRDLILEAARRFGFSYRQISLLTGTDRQTVWHAMGRIARDGLSSAQNRAVIAIMDGARQIMDHERRRQ